MTRKAALATLKAAGAENDRKTWARVYVENRVSLPVALQMWREGEAFARWVANRDAKAARLSDQEGRTPSVAGEHHGSAKLTPAQVEAIRLDPRTVREIATDYGITNPQISRIKTGQNWK